jgi:hypothetical protein
MSAIPWIGQDIVESKTLIEILTQTNSLQGFTLEVGNNGLFFCSLILTTGLPIIGIISSKVHIDRKNRLTDNEYLSIPTSFLAFLVGLIDGDGYIQITKTEKGYIAIKLTISIHLEDISVLNYIQSVLKIGKIKSYSNHKSPTCKLIINKTELQEIFFPLLLYHKIFFLTKTRRDQFNKAMCIMVNDIKLFSNIPEDPKIVNVLPSNPEGYLNLFFFRNWLVGFTMAEGSFFIKSNNDGYFQLKQRLHIELFEAIKLLFNTNRKIGIDKDLYIQFGVSSKKDIQNIINFFSFSGVHPLIGLKGIQYSIWLIDLHNSVRYKDLKYPD